MDKLTIVMSNYIDVECDANTTPRQAYERGFRRATEKCETVMRSRKTKIDALDTENAKLRELFSKVYGYYVSGTLTPCDFCDKYCCEGYAPTTCKSDEYDPDGIVVEEVERLMSELGIEVKE